MNRNCSQFSCFNSLGSWIENQAEVAYIEKPVTKLIDPYVVVAQNGKILTLYKDILFLRASIVKLNDEELQPTTLSIQD